LIYFLSNEQIANLLYGPSYVSLEWALSFYGMIPERVYTITSMTLGRNKKYSTVVGDFMYYSLSPESYSQGITHLTSPDFLGGFLMATPEKALIDFVFKRCKKLTKSQLKIELLESQRMESSTLQQLNKNFLKAWTDNYKSTSVKNLVDILGLL
jgi:hypothetical protein